MERPDLRPLFNQFDRPDEKVTGSAYLQRRPIHGNDLASADRNEPRLLAVIDRRPAPSIMRVADDARDGSSAALLIQVATEPCGKHQMAAVGVTKAIPRLHALTPAGHPEKPLIMPPSAWQARVRP